MLPYFIKAALAEQKGASSRKAGEKATRGGQGQARDQDKPGPAAIWGLLCQSLEEALRHQRKLLCWWAWCQGA